MSIKVILCDDHTLVRAGLKQLLEENSHDIRVDEVESGKDVLKKIEKDSYDVLVLDISMPDQNGLDVLKNVKRMKPELPVLMLSRHAEEQYAIRSLRAGASGYLTKQSAPNELIKAIKRIIDGRKYVSSSLAEKLAELVDEPKLEPHEMLSDREYQVFTGIAAGKSNNELASELNLSDNTISTYRARVLEKLNLKNNAELIRYALKNNLVD